MVFLTKKNSKNLSAIDLDIYLNGVRRVRGGEWHGYGFQQYFKLRKVYYASSSVPGYFIWNFIWTPRIELNPHSPIRLAYFFNEIGITDVYGFQTVTDEFGNIFRSFFIACDFEDLRAAVFGFQQVIIGVEINFE